MKMFDKSPLVRLIGFPATLIHGDTTVLDRWLWLRSRLPKTRSGEFLLDVGCGSGAFTIGAALRGYRSIGISWDARNQKIAQERAHICKAKDCNFEVMDVRRLDEKTEFINKFDVVVNFENIEHIIDDRKLMMDIFNCLKPGGRLLLTAPYFHFKPITDSEIGPFSSYEDGGHVRRGYLKSMLVELCDESNFVIEDFSFCSGFFSQKTTYLLRTISSFSHALAWILTFPLRLVAPILDKICGSRNYSICIEAYKPRFAKSAS